MTQYSLWTRPYDTWDHDILGDTMKTTEEVMLAEAADRATAWTAEIAKKRTLAEGEEPSPGFVIIKHPKDAKGETHFEMITVWSSEDVEDKDVHRIVAESTEADINEAIKAAIA